MDADALREWLDALDYLSYYDLFRVTPDASPDEVRNAFHAFAESFHPDVHQWRPPQELVVISYIFRRGTEAYRVLSDPLRRVRYNEALMEGVLRPESLLVDLDSSRAPSRSMAPSGRLADSVRVVSARPFVARAEQLVKAGDPQQAKLQLVMAMHRDPNNPSLEAFARELDELRKAKANTSKK